MFKPDVLLNIFRYSFVFLMSYGMLYFSLRYFDPWVTGIDYFTYKEMISAPLDFSIAASPFVYRQFSTCIAALFYNFDFFYDLGITYGENLEEKKIFFSAMLSNFTALLFTGIFTIRILDKEIGKTIIASLLAVLILFLSFGTINYVLAGLVEGWTWFFVLIAFNALKNKRIHLFGFVILLSIFQKELISIVFCILSSYYYVLTVLNKKKDNSYLIMLMYAMLSSFLYLLVRTRLLPSHGFETQLDSHFFIESLKNITFQEEMVLNLIASQNLILVYIATSISFCLILQKPIKEIKMLNDARGIIIVSIFITFIGLGNQVGNNLGRYLLIFSPIWAIIIVTNLVVLDNYFKNSNHKLS